ncbi:hypothetical protein D9757_011224 [Collybiopsis confluens]|uniref:Protein kinase domain-containing protein n=1 Tax=Collybiopsis confluens TaxID=2823264 RepID=A0A8H5LSU9_9AGAR|nr:hypothetical protein D9757_011224 [Collybiopsis confluens]
MARCVEDTPEMQGGGAGLIWKVAANGAPVLKLYFQLHPMAALIMALIIFVRSQTHLAAGQKVNESSDMKSACAIKVFLALFLTNIVVSIPTRRARNSTANLKRDVIVEIDGVLTFAKSGNLSGASDQAGIIWMILFPMAHPYTYNGPHHLRVLTHVLLVRKCLCPLFFLSVPRRNKSSDMKFACAIKFFPALFLTTIVVSIPTRRAQDPAWLGKELAETLTSEEKQVFATKFNPKEITFGKLISRVGNTGNVYSLTKFKSETGPLVAKVYGAPPATLNARDFAEVKGLKMVGDFVGSGQITENAIHDDANGDKMSAVIVMRRKKGLEILDTPQYDAAIRDRATEKAFMSKLGHAYCEEVAKVAVQKGVYREDHNLGNFLVSFVGKTDQIASLDLVDWGHPRAVVKPVTEKQVLDYCMSDLPKNGWD